MGCFAVGISATNFKRLNTSLPNPSMHCYLYPTLPPIITNANCDDDDTMFHLFPTHIHIFSEVGPDFVEGYNHMEICTVKIHLKMTSNNVNRFDIGNLKYGIYDIGIEIYNVKSTPGILTYCFNL